MQVQVRFAGGAGKRVAVTGGAIPLAQFAHPRADVGILPRRAVGLLARRAAKEEPIGAIVALFGRGSSATGTSGVARPAGMRLHRVVGEGRLGTDLVLSAVAGEKIQAFGAPEACHGVVAQRTAALAVVALKHVPVPEFPHGTIGDTFSSRLSEVLDASGAFGFVVARGTPHGAPRTDWGHCTGISVVRTCSPAVFGAVPLVQVRPRFALMASIRIPASGTVVLTNTALGDSLAIYLEKRAFHVAVFYATTIEQQQSGSTLDAPCIRITLGATFGARNATPFHGLRERPHGTDLHASGPQEVRTVPTPGAVGGPRLAFIARVVALTALAGHHVFEIARRAFCDTVKTEEVQPLRT